MCCPLLNHSTLIEVEQKICSNDLLLYLNFRARSKLSLVQALMAIAGICLDQVHVFESVTPGCLRVSVFACTILFMSNGGCCGGFAFREKTIDNVLPVSKATNHASAHVLIVFRFMFSECAAPLGDSTMMYKLVSSANKQI